MCSYLLGIVMCVLLSSLYVFQNPEPVSVTIFNFSYVFPHGLLCVMFFAVGAVLMWLISVFAMIEVRSGYRSKIKDLESRASSLEEEKASLLNAFKHLPDPDRESRSEESDHVLRTVPQDDAPMDIVAAEDGIVVEKESVSF